jgi:hypothetical protein
MDFNSWGSALVVCIVVLPSIIWTTNRRIDELRSHLENLDRIRLPDEPVG